MFPHDKAFSLLHFLCLYICSLVMYMAQAGFPMQVLAQQKFPCLIETSLTMLEFLVLIILLVGKYCTQVVHIKGAYEHYFFCTAFMVHMNSAGESQTSKET